MSEHYSEYFNFLAAARQKTKKYGFTMKDCKGYNTNPAKNCTLKMNKANTIRCSRQEIDKLKGETAICIYLVDQAVLVY